MTFKVGDYIVHRNWDNNPKQVPCVAKIVKIRSNGKVLAEYYYGGTIPLTVDEYAEDFRYAKPEELI